MAKSRLFQTESAELNVASNQVKSLCTFRRVDALKNMEEKALSRVPTDG